MTIDLPSLLTLVGVVLTVIGGLAVAVLKWKPDMITAQGGRIDSMWDRLDEQDAKIRDLEDKVHRLEMQAERDKDVRHKLKNALIYVVSIANAAIARIVEDYTDSQIARLAEPLRSHVRDKLAGRHPFEDHLDLTRPRTHPHPHD